jgi:hypothetical protein
MKWLKKIIEKLSGKRVYAIDRQPPTISHGRKVYEGGLKSINCYVDGEITMAFVEGNNLYCFQKKDVTKSISFHGINNGSITYKILPLDGGLFQETRNALSALIDACNLSTEEGRSLHGILSSMLKSHLSMQEFYPELLSAEYRELHPIKS